MAGYKFKSVVNSKEVELLIKPENLDTERKCDTEYHVAMTQLLQKGIKPRATLEKIMHEQGIWTEEDEKKLLEFQTTLAELEAKLKDAKTHEDGLGVAREMGQLRSKCLQLVEAKANILASSCESLADRIRQDAFIAYSTVYVDSSKQVFKDYFDFLTRAEEQVVLDAKKALLDMATKAFSESLGKLPEVQYLKQVEQAVANKD